MDKDFFRTSVDATGQINVLALDPGETTGMAAFRGSHRLVATQLQGHTVPAIFRQIRTALNFYHPDAVVMEDYRVYSWKTRDHANSDMFTSRLIGAVECLCEDLQVPLKKQMAGIAKGFCTDDKLRMWDLYAGGRHSRDATRHAVYYLLFDHAHVHKRQGEGNGKTGS